MQCASARARERERVRGCGAAAAGGGDDGGSAEGRDDGPSPWPGILIRSGTHSLHRWNFGESALSCCGRLLFAISRATGMVLVGGGFEGVVGELLYGGLVSLSLLGVE